MNKLILSKEQISDLVQSNKYRIDEKNKFISRCVDGRYPDDKDLPALAIPGADAGEVALIMAAANIYGLEVNYDKTFESLTDVIGGVKNFNFHSDNHAGHKVPAAGCGHMKQINLDSAAYHLNKDQTDFLNNLLIKAKKKGARETVLTGEHLEGAVLQLKGRYGVYPQYFFDTANGEAMAQTFIFHGTLVNERHRVLANTLLRNEAVKLFTGMDEEYLYEVLSEVTDEHLFETLRRLAKGLPIYLVEFDTEGGFKIEEMGTV